MKNYKSAIKQKGDRYLQEWLKQAIKKETYEEFRKAVLYGISEEAARFFADDAPQKYSFEKRDGQLEMAWD